MRLKSLLGAHFRVSLNGIFIAETKKVKIPDLELLTSEIDTSSTFGAFDEFRHKVGKLDISTTFVGLPADAIGALGEGHLTFVGHQGNFEDGFTNTTIHGRGLIKKASPTDFGNEVTELEVTMNCKYFKMDMAGLKPTEIDVEGGTVFMINGKDFSPSSSQPAAN